MVSPSLRERATSPEYTTPTQRIIDVSSESPALMRSASSHGETNTEGDAMDEEDDDESDATAGSGLAELELTEHEYRRGHQAIPMQSPGEELGIDLDDEETNESRSKRRRRRLPSLRRRHFFEGSDASFERPSGRGRMMQRITFRRRKSGENDVFWTGILISNLLSLAVMIVLMFYLLQTDFFESHQSDLFGTTVDNRFTVVSPENTDAKIYMKSGYSTSRYSEAMIAFGKGELKIGRRALAATDAQGFYGMSIASNGSTSFTNKLNAPFVKTDYLHAVRAVVFDDGTAMTTAANLSGGINEVGNLNLNSKTGSITLGSGGKPVVRVDPDATVNLLKAGDDDMEAAGITFDAAHGDISIASTFKIHHDENATVLSSSNPIELNSTQLVVGSVNSTKTVITVPSVAVDATPASAAVYERMTLAIVGQSSANQSHGGQVVMSGGTGSKHGGDVVLTGGVSSENEDGDVMRGSVLINAKLERTTTSTTEIGSHSKSHKVNLHGAVSINNATESGHGTTLYVGGGNVLATSKNFTIDNLAANQSAVVVKSNRISLEASSAATMSMDINETRLIGSKTLSLSLAQRTNNSGSAMLTMDDAGVVKLNATRLIHMNATGANASINLYGAVRFGGDLSDGNGSTSSADMIIDDGSIVIDADSFVIGGAGNTDTIALMSKDIDIGNSSQKSSLKLAGENASILCKHVNIGTSVSNVSVAGKEISLHAVHSSENSTKSALLSVKEEGISMTGTEVIIGDNAAGSSSTKRISIAASDLELGASAKSVRIGNKGATVKIGSEASIIDIKGKVTINGHALDSRRRLEAFEAPFFASKRADRLVLQLPASNDEVQVPAALAVNPMGAFKDVDGGDIELVESSVTSATTHLRLSLSLEGVRMRVDPEVVQETKESGRTPKLRCRVYKVDKAASVSVALEVVSQLERCASDEDCTSGFFLGASCQRIAAVHQGDRLSLRCAASSTGLQKDETRTVFIESIQLDISTLS